MRAIVPATDQANRSCAREKMSAVTRGMCGRRGAIEWCGKCANMAATANVLPTGAVQHERTGPFRCRRGCAFNSARQARRQQSETLPGRHLVSVFRAPAPRRPGALVRGWHVRLVLVGDQVQGHHACRDASPALFVRSASRRHNDHRSSGRIPSPQFHFVRSALSRRAAQGGQPRRCTDEFAASVGDDPRARAGAFWMRCRATRRSTGYSMCRSS